jgi:hypothetical protein
MQNLRFSQWHCWIFKSSGLLCHVDCVCTAQ